MNLVKELEDVLKQPHFMGAVDKTGVNLAVNAILDKIDSLGFDIVEKPKEKENVGKLALLGDVWYQVLDYRIVDGRIEYKLYTKENWIPSDWVKEFKERKSS